jgi:pimeloyl-ACP methyl ester carboxylesterase
MPCNPRRHATFSPISLSALNRRTDEWGGSAENRRRFHTELVKRVRREIGPDYPLFIKYGIQEDREGGLTLDEGIRTAQEMAAAGIDLIEVSGGDSGGAIPPAGKDGKEATVFGERAAALKRAIDVPVAVVAGIRRYETAADILARGDADIVSMCRPFIREPGLIERWRKGDTSPATCISCNRCLAKGSTLACAEEEKLKDADMPLPKQTDNALLRSPGKAEPVVQSGLGSNGGGWFRQVPDLSRDYAVVTFDSRGTGRSDKPDEAYTLDTLTDDVAGLLDANGMERAHIFGVSMGGRIAQQFVLTRPERVISLILGCTFTGRAHNPPRPGGGNPFDTSRMKEMTPKEWARERLVSFVSRRFIESNPAVIEEWLDSSTAWPTPEYTYARQMAAGAGYDSYDRLPSVTAPTLVISGDADVMVSAENSRILASRIPGAELVILPGGGHGFRIEYAEETNRAVRDFLRRHPASGA